MTSVEWAFAGLGVAAFMVALFGMRRYRTPLNPLTMFAVTEIGLFTIFSGIVAVSIADSGDIPAAMIDTASISLIYLGATTLPFFFRGAGLSNLFGKGMGLLKLSSDSLARRFSHTKFIILLSATAVSFIALAYLGGGGLLWLTDTREAYQNHRAGAGPFFALTQWLLTFALLYQIWTRKPRSLKLILILFLFCFAMYFLGSKNNILTLLVIGIAYYNFYVKRISPATLLALIVLMVLTVLGLLIIQGSYSSLLEGLLYFQDYFNTTAQFISRFDEFGFRYGQGWLSSLWFYVPRGLYSDKPYEYGFTLIHEVLFPGAAELGHTPGLLSWSLAYLDYGVVGVLVYGLVFGIWQKMAYEYFLGHKRKFFAFVLGMQFSIWPVWSFAPLIFVVILSIGQSIFLRSVCKFGFNAPQTPLNRSHPPMPAGEVPER